MPTLPSASTRLQSQAGTAPASTDLIAIVAPVATAADGVPRLYSGTQDAIDAHTYAEGLEYLALHLDGTGKPALLVPVPIATAGAIVRSESIHTGTSKVTIAVGGSGALAEVAGIFKVVTGGTVGTDQIILNMSLDDGTSWKRVRLGSAVSYTIPNVGLVVSFGVGTLVAEDTILEWKNSGPKFDATGVTTAKTGLTAQQRVVKSVLFVGDVSTLALGQEVESFANTYETGVERYVEAKFQTRDRRVLENSKDRCAMVGSNTVTFAEVGATGDTITRSAGSFVTDGFQVGDYIRVTGSVSNNVSGKITAVTATVLTLDTTDLAAEGPVSGVRITAEPSFTTATGPDTITRNRGSWLAEGFAIGDVVTITDLGSGTISALTATVMTFSNLTLPVSVVGSCTTSITLTETKAAHVAAMNALFATIDGSERVDIGHGRLTKLSPITGFTMRRPVQWADSIRSYQHDIHITTWWKDLGPLDGWGIDGEHDERVDGGALDAKFTCARTWGNGPEGTFIAMSLTRATDGDALGMTHNMYVANLVQTIVQRETESFTGRTIVLNADGTATTSELADLEARVNRELQRNLLSNIGGEGARASECKWTASTADVLNVADATLNGVCTLKIRGTIVHVNTKVKVS